ncbi:MAG: histidine kinase, partial [Bacteroidia bacterium]|nr:histidine kinase [Bacteroidia bacterium]
AYTVYLRRPEDIMGRRLFDERLYSFCIQDDRLWMGTFKGLMYYDIPADRISDVQFSVPGNGRIEALQSVGHDVLLLGTSNQGLFFVKDGRVLKNVGVTDGLFDPDCKEIDAFAGGWVVRHPIGLSMIDVHTREIRTLSQWNNIPVSSINSISISGDSILLSTTGGLFIESLKNMFRQRNEIRRVELLRISGREGQLFPQDLQLPYTENKLKIEFAMPEYDQPEMIVYQWRINKGIWNNAATNILDLADLSSGDYLLEIRGRAPGYRWSAITGLSFSVETPFWRSPVFFVLLVFVLVLSLSFAQQFRYRRQLQSEREKASLQYQLINYEQRALNAMMNPHFVFNAMGSIQYLLNKGDVEEANNYLVKFSRLIRKSLEALQKEYCVLEDEIERLTLYLQMEKMRLEGRLHVHIEVDKNLDAEKLSIPGMILQTYVENAVVHGIDPLKKETHIRLLFRAEGDRLLVSISDNGPGFNTDNTEKRSRRFGLSATEKRLALLSKITGKPHRVSILSPADEDGGTLVRLEFPLQQVEL